MTRHEPAPPPAASTNAITDLGAVELSALIHARQVRCREVMDAYLARIHAINPTANAIVNLADDEILLKQADECDAELSAGFSRGWMHGIPQAIKDLNDAAGFPTTSGSPLLTNFRPKHDGLLAERMRAAGSIVIGKTNVPEFGLGSHTFNPVFGPTPNAYSADHTAGGSSGGAASALAHRMLPVADGSDYGGSLRNPAAWNNIFGFRPSQGRVPDWPSTEGWIRSVATDGPMGRSVADVAALFATQAGWDPRDPLAIPRTDQLIVLRPRCRHRLGRDQRPEDRLARRSRRPSADGAGRARRLYLRTPAARKCGSQRRTGHPRYRP